MWRRWFLALMPPRPKQSIEVKINLQSIAGNAFSNPVGIYVCPFFVIVFVVKFLCGGPNTQPYTFYHVRGFVCLSLCVCVCVCRWMWVFYSSDARMSLYAYNDKVNRNRVESKKHNQSKSSRSIIHVCWTWGGHSDYKGFSDLKLLVTYKYHPAYKDFSQHSGNQYSDILHGVLYAKFSLIFLMLKASFHTKTGHESLEGE